MKGKALLFLILRVALGLIFVVSGFQKLMTPYQNFVAVIEKFEILKGASVVIVAQTLPWVEFVGGVFFVFGLWTRVSLLILWAMNTAFIGILAQALIRKLDIQSCGCFGEAVSLSVPKILAIDIVTWFLFFLFFFAGHRVKAPALDHLIGKNAQL